MFRRISFLKRQLFPFFLLIPHIFTSAYLQRNHGDLCDWRGPAETCDQSRGLTCSYDTHRCGCWHIRTIYSPGKGRCVGKAGEQCHFFGGERLCTENAYCLEDESLSPIPICLCLKGYFKGSNGSCIRRSKYGEFCDLSSKYSPSGRSSSGVSGVGSSGAIATSTTSTNSNCEPESGLQCINYTCQCESNQIYDPNRELCISQAGLPCSKSLGNCVENAECSEKIWAFDHPSGETKMIGHRCACKPGLKVTEDGFCAVEYGGDCATSSECYFGKGLTCVNSKCQCHPLSQVYDSSARKCLNLVGTKCQAQPGKQDRISPQQEVERPVMDFTSKPQQPSVSSTPTTFPTSSSTASPPTSSTKITEAKNTTSHSQFMTTTSKLSTSGRPYSTVTTAKSMMIPTSTSTSFNLPSPTTTTTQNPNSIKSRNLTSRNFHFSHSSNNNDNNPGGSNNFSNEKERQRQGKSLHFISPRHHHPHHSPNGHYYYRHLQDESFIPEHRSSSQPGLGSWECVTNAECMSSSSSDSYCKCRNGSSETILRTCLLDHGEPCGQSSRSGGEGELRIASAASSSLDCNIYKGLVCQSDTGTCQCADPMLIYDEETRACLSFIGNPCGRMKLNSLLFRSSFTNNQMQNGQNANNKKMIAGEASSIPPFYPYRDEQFIYIGCGDNATCVEASTFNGQFHQVCALRGKIFTK